MKGFISAVLIITIFLAAIIMLNVSYQETETVSFKETMLDQKILIANYEITLKRAMEGKNLLDADIDGNSEAILKTAKPGHFECSADITKKNAGEAISKLGCSSVIIMENEVRYKSHFSKKITITN